MKYLLMIKGNCKWNDDFIKVENAICEDSTLQIAHALIGKNEQTCKDACKANSLCVDFNLNSGGSCQLWKKGCQIKRVTTSNYYSKRIVELPNKTEGKCSHNMFLSQNKAVVD